MKKAHCLALFLVLGMLSLLGILGGRLAQAVSAATSPAADPVIGQPFLIDSGISAATNPVVAVAHNSNRHQFLVAYETGGGWFSLALYNANGALAWDPPIVNLAYGEHPALAYNSALDQYLLVWQEKNPSNQYDVRGIRLSHDGITAIGNAFDISTRPWHQQKPAVAFNPHGNYQDYLVVWEDVDPTWVPQVWDIWAQRLAGAHNGGDFGGQLIGSNFAVAYTGGFWHSEPDVAHNLNMNEYMVVYTRQPDSGGTTDVYNRRITRDGVLLAENAIDSSANDQRHPAVATYRLNQNTPYFVVFEDYWNDPAGDVRGYLANKDGQSQSLVNIADTPGRQEREPDIASSEGLGYTVVWAQYQPSPGQDWEIYGRRVSDTGIMGPALNVSLPDGFVIVGHDERNPTVAGGSPVALAAWDGNFAGLYDIAGRMLGYQLSLPLVLRNHQ